MEKIKKELDVSFNNEFEKQLEEAGYKWFQDNWKDSIRGFQKRFRDEKGTRYFITGYHWNFEKTHPEWANQAALKGDRYGFDCQFNIDDKDGGKCQTIDVRFSADMLPNEWRSVTTLKEVEEFYEKFFTAMNCSYYELNN